MENSDTVLDNIDRSIIEYYNSETPRWHLGMSQIGKKDSRYLWLKFRWSLPGDLSARVIRILNIGNLIEDEVIRLLRNAGYTLLDRDKLGKQFKTSSIGGHFSGSCDGIITGTPVGDSGPYVFECKSARNKRFKQFKKNGVKETSDEYYAQLQCYMKKFECDNSLFVMYNKDTSELYTEIIEIDHGYYHEAESRAFSIISSNSPPASIYPNRSWYEAKFISDKAQAVYWGYELPPVVNCRNCRHSCPIIDGNGARWCCRRVNKIIPHDIQVQGCENHNFIPDLVPAEMIKIHHEFDAVEYRTKKGTRFFNGPLNIENKEVFSSSELIYSSRSGFSCIDDKTFIEIRGYFGGRIVPEI